MGIYNGARKELMGGQRRAFSTSYMMVGCWCSLRELFTGVFCGGDRLGEVGGCEEEETVREK